MLSGFRSIAKSPIAIVLFGLLIVSFAVFGIQDVFRGQVMGDIVVKAGDRTVTPLEFRRTFDNYRSQMQKQGQTVTAEEADKAGLIPRMVQSLAEQKSFDALMAKIGVRPSDKLIADEIGKAPVFFDQVTGKFDKKAYEGWLAQNNMTAAQLESELRDGVAEAHLASGLVAAMKAPEVYGAIAAAFQQEARSFSGFVLSPRIAGEPPKPTDADLLKFMKANAARFTKPETRLLSYVHFSAATELAKVTPTAADLQKRFDFEKDTLSTPERRTVVSIAVNDPAKGADAAARLKKGEDPAAVAKSLGVQPVVYEQAAKTAISDRKVADAAFALKEGETTGPIQGSLGSALVKVTKVTAGHQVTLDEVREKIEAEVRKDLATEKVYEQVQKFEDARSGGATIAEAAKTVGATLVTAPGAVSAQGVDLQGRKIELPEQALQAAFMLPPSGDSDMIDAGMGEYYAVRAEKVFPSALASVEEVRAPATQVFQLDWLTKQLEAKANALAAEVKKGKTLEAAAQSVGSPVSKATDIRRAAADNQSFSRELIAQVFGAKKGEVFVGRAGEIGFLVARLDDIKSGAGPDVARMAQAQSAQMSQGLMQSLGVLARTAARDTVKPVVNVEKARTALGLEAAAAAAKPAPAGKSS
jgi:peptidyl-prolyl cis-trans isomerase D